MKKKSSKPKILAPLDEKFPPSEPCSCETCLSYCKRPGWWTVKGAEKAIDAGFAQRMMLEMAPDRSFGVLSPAYTGCEMNFASNFFSNNGCNFLVNNLCQLHGTGHQPIECRFCHHERVGEGIKCHTALEKDWNSIKGKALVVKWTQITNFMERQQMLRMVNLKI